MANNSRILGIKKENLYKHKHIGSSLISISVPLRLVPVNIYVLFPKIVKGLKIFL